MLKYDDELHIRAFQHRLKRSQWKNFEPEAAMRYMQILWTRFSEGKPAFCSIAVTNPQELINELSESLELRNYLLQIVQAYLEGKHNLPTGTIQQGSGTSFFSRLIASTTRQSWHFLKASGKPPQKTTTWYTGTEPLPPSPEEASIALATRIPPRPMATEL